MSGHSKWSKIKRAKAANDAQRGKAFTRLAKSITIAAQQGGGDPDMNFALRIAIDRAKAENLPNDNINRAIKSGTGELGEGKLVSVLYEAFGPAGSALLINSETDNTNRALTEIKTIVQSKGGKLTSEGSVSWQFSEKGYFLMYPKRFQESEKYGKDGEYVSEDAEELVLELMEVPGVEDVKLDTDTEEVLIEATTSRDDFASVHKQIEKLGIKIETAELAWIPNETQDLSEEDNQKLEGLLEALDESDEVSNVWHNAA